MIFATVSAQTVVAQLDSPGPDRLPGAIVRTRRPRASAPSFRVRADEAREAAATQGDPVRVVESAPGIGRAAFGDGQLILWGAAPETSRVYVDGIPIPALFHGGGVRGTVQSPFVGGVEVVPAGYGAEYGSSTGGLVLLESAMPSAEHALRISADLIDAAAVAATRRGRLETAAGLRWGYLRDVIATVTGADALGAIAIPRYEDYQARLHYHADSGSDLTVFAFGSLDRLDLPTPGDDQARMRTHMREDDFHRIALRLLTRNSANHAVAEMTVWAGLDRRWRRDAVGPFESALRRDSVLGGLRANYALSLGDVLSLRTGLTIEVGEHQVQRTGSLSRPPVEGDPYVYGQTPADDSTSDSWTVRIGSIAPWIELPITLASGHVFVVPGLRADRTVVEASRALPPVGDTPSRGVARVSLVPQPRVAARFELVRNLALSAPYGVYTMPPRPEDLSARFGNPVLDGTVAQHVTAGLSARPAAPLTSEVTMFFRRTTGVAVRPAEPTRAGEALVASGISESTGVQVTLRCASIGGFSGWLAYTLSRSTVVEPTASTGRLSDYDQTHLVTIVARQSLAHGFGVGSRLRVATGMPRTAVVGRVLDATTGDYQPVFGGRNDDRLPPFAGFDVRIDWHGRVSDLDTEIWIDALNVSGQASIEEVLYDPTYQERRYITGLPLFVDLGARVAY